MTAVIVDASLALKWVVIEDLTVEARALLRIWTHQSVQILAPALFEYEVAHVLSRWQQSGYLTLEQARLSFEDVRNRMTMYPNDTGLTFRAFEIGNMARRPDVYDAQYLALAEREDCEYWTADERFWNATKAMFPHVRWLGERRS